MMLVTAMYLLKCIYIIYPRLFLKIMKIMSVFVHIRIVERDNLKRLCVGRQSADALNQVKVFNDEGGRIDVVLEFNGDFSR